MLSSQQKTVAIYRPPFCKGVPSNGGHPLFLWRLDLAAFTHGQPVDKKLPLTKIKLIAVEAFGRHQKRVDASALFFTIFYSMLDRTGPCGEVISRVLFLY